MANQVSLQAHTQAGDEVIAHPMAHIVRAESAAGGALAGVQFRTLGAADGTMPVEQVAGALSDGSNPHFAPTGLIAMENTHNFAGGAVLPLEGIEAVAALAKKHGIPMHLDGARVLNAAVALDVQPTRITGAFDTTTLCFSKGLGAPVGSILAGSKAFIARAYRLRKMLGGGMRQAGYLAAAARYALRNHVQRLGEDHEHARALAQGIAETEHLELVYGMPETNIVFFRCTHPTLTMPQVAEAVKGHGVLIGATGPDKARAVTHLQVERAGVEQAVGALRSVLAA